jgi:hypothetical protein
MLFYDPEAHPGDRLMSSWLAREAARFKPKTGKKFADNLVNR